MKVLKSTKTKLGNEIKLIGEENSRKILVIGVFHGEEPQGKFLIEEYLRTHSSNLFFIPCLNPDGVQFGKRTNANGVDLNRNYPTNNWQLTERNEFFGGEAPASEIETKFMVEVIEEYNPELILALHAPFMVVNYDGPAKEIAEKISKIINYPVQESIGYPTPGSFGTYCGVERNIPTITLELDEKIPVENLLEPVHKIFDMLQFET
ncbi:DUF2817 domain-containing protein [bacterium]|nr:DUF2817 domain-containing protein [bacterium]